MGRMVEFRDDFCVELTPGTTDAMMKIIAHRQGLVDTCELCGVDVWDGETVCRKCRKKINTQRRILRLVKAKRKERSYDRV